MLGQRLAPLLCFVVVGLSLSLQSHAHDRIVVPFSPLSPWKFVDENGFGGAYAELVRAIAGQMKMPIEFIECPLKRCLRLMETGEANLIIGVKASADRLVYMRFLKTPYRTSSAKVFYVRKGLGKVVQKYSDLDGLRIGMKLGAKYFKRFDHDTTIQKVVVRTNSQNFEMLARGRTDGLIIAEDQGEYWISQLRYRGRFDKAAYLYRDHSPRSIGISRRSTLIHQFDAIEAAMEGLVKDGKLKDIVRKHYFERFDIPADSGIIQGSDLP